MKKLLLLTLAALPLFAAGQVPSYVPTNGLVAWWPFNGNANDESGNGNNGTVNGATLTTDRNGNANSAYYFSSSGCGTRIDVNVNTTSIQTGLTMSVWVMNVGSGCIGPRLLEFWPGSNGPGMAQWGTDYNLGIWGMGSLTSTGFSCAASIPMSANNVWAHLVYTNDGTVGKFYKNGVLVTSVQSTGNPILASSAAFGRMNHPAYDAYNGNLDDIGIWNRALTPCEIQTLYNSGTGLATVASSASSVCSGNSITISASGASTYFWMPGNLVGDSVSVAPTTTTTYTVTGTDSVGCTSIDSVTITVNPLPQVSAGSTTTNYCLADASGNLVGVPTSGIWSGPGVTGNTFNPSTAGAGTHNVIYTYTDSNGCSNSDTLVMTVDLCTGIQEVYNTAFSVFPNPANNNITVSWSNAEVKTLTLRDASGRAVRTYNVSGTQAQLSLEGLANGVYFLNVNEETKSVQKIIKQ